MTTRSSTGEHASSLRWARRAAKLGGYHIYVSDLSTGDVAELGVFTRHVSQSVHGLGLSPDGRSLYVTDVQAVTDTYLRSVEVGAHPNLIARSPDSRRLYVTDNGSRGVSVLDIGSDPANPRVLVANVPVAGYPHGLAVTPDGLYVVVANTYGGTLSVIVTRTNTDIGTIPAEKFPNDVVITG
jgi:YVTN family beta-propeller protein